MSKVLQSETHDDSKAANIYKGQIVNVVFKLKKTKQLYPLFSYIKCSRLPAANHFFSRSEAQAHTNSFTVRSEVTVKQDNVFRDKWQVSIFYAAL